MSSQLTGHVAISPLAGHFDACKEAVLMNTLSPAEPPPPHDVASRSPEINLHHRAP